MARTDEIGPEPERAYRVVEVGDNGKSIVQVLAGDGDVGAARTAIVECLIGAAAHPDDACRGTGLAARGKHAARSGMAAGQARGSIRNGRGASCAGRRTNRPGARTRRVRAASAGRGSISAAPKWSALGAPVRRQYPERGLAPERGDFSAAAAEAGLPPLPVAVKVSAPQFRMRDFHAGVTAALDRANLDARWRELELTAGIPIEDDDQVSCLLDDLKALGVGVAVDDFGTGCPSLANVKRVAVDKLQVDGSFIGDLTEDADDLAVAAGIIAMVHRPGLRVLAEGVAKAEQLAILRAEAGDEFQGYRFGAPLPPEAVPAPPAFGPGSDRARQCRRQGRFRRGH